MRSMISRSLVSRSKVCSWLTDLAASPPPTGDASMPRARARQQRALAAEAARQQVLGQRRQVADGGHAVVRQGGPGPFADAPQPRDGQRRQERPPRSPAAPPPGRRACAGPRRSWPPAWWPPRRPTRSAGAASRMAARIGRAIASGVPSSASVPATSRNASSMETCSTSGLKRRRMAITCRLTAAYLRPSTGTKTRARAERGRRAQGHRRAHPETARLVRGSADHAAVVRPAATDDHGLTAQLGSVALLDGSEERVEVDVQDGCAATGICPASHAPEASPWARPRW